MIQYSQNLDILTQKTLLKYPDLLKLIREKLFKISDTELTYRQINSLDEANLIKNNRNSNKDWRKFNLNDLFYLHIINKTREFNTSNAQLKYLKDFFYGHKINFKNIGYVLSSEEALIGLIVGVVPIGMLFFSDGQAIITDNTDISFRLGHSDIYRRPYMFFNLYQSFEECLNKVKLQPNFKDKFEFKDLIDEYSVKPISRQQRILLRIVENNKYSKIIISKKQDGAKLIKAEQSVDGTALTKEDIIQVIDGIEFGSVELKKQNGKATHYVVDKLYKI